ncbi:MAG: DPP IV N-terminal domain-containing protein [Candidatus Cloacimonetes bacterium]|nr:DPP IV N-terminal domain-containing protein [Candidatus Cloacimonadota bacterium]
MVFFIFIISACTQVYDTEMSKPNLKLAEKITAATLDKHYFGGVIVPQWTRDDNTFWYVKNTSSGPELYFVDISQNSRTRMRTVFHKTDTWHYSFEYNGESYSYNSYSKQIEQSLSESAEPGIKSPDGKYVVYIQNHNLFLKKIGSNIQPRQLSLDDEKYYSFQETDFFFSDEDQYDDSKHYRPYLEWSHDSRYFVAGRIDARHLKDMWIINSLSKPRASLSTYKQRQPGEARRYAETWLYNMDNGSFACVASGKENGTENQFMTWSKDNRTIYMLEKNIDQMSAKIQAYDVKTGKFLKTIIEEESGGIVITKNLITVPGTTDLLWWSRRDGHGHYYLYDEHGNLKMQVTHGNFNVKEIMTFDAEKGLLYFMANGSQEDINPYYEFLYQLNIMNGQLTLLTPEDANHSVYFSPDNIYFVDTFSRPDMQHKTVVRDYSGNLIMELEQPSIKELQNLNWVMPEVYTVKATDRKTDLWGVMWKPFNLDPEKKYPIITFVYPGPQFNYVPTTFFTEPNNVHLAQYGFIVMMCGTRGSSYDRSLEFSEYYRGNVRDYPLADNKYAIEQLAEKYPYIDIDRVGIWGGSSGGYMAVSAMLTYPDFYKVGVSRAGQHNPETFHGWWSDYFQGVDEQGNTIPAQSNLELVNNLKGKLFLIHNEMDKTVHPSQTALLVDELMKAGKDFDYLVVPGGDHGWSKNWQYVQRRIWLYFVEHLLDWHDPDVNIF